MLADDEYIVEHPRIRSLVRVVQELRHAGTAPARILDAVRAPFAALLADAEWLPEEFQQPDRSSGMGSGIGQYLLYRAGDGSLSLFSLVVPPGASTPVHDHLVWGLVGLYRGEQREDVFELVSGLPEEGRVVLRLYRSRSLRVGDFYPLLPPVEDIHRVTTTSEDPSVSIHLLANDTGCVIRHRFDPDTGRVSPFRSGYSNRPCPEPAG